MLRLQADRSDAALLRCLAVNADLPAFRRRHSTCCSQRSAELAESRSIRSPASLSGASVRRTCLPRNRTHRQP
jgi:hypothetical protein